MISSCSSKCKTRPFFHMNNSFSFASQRKWSGHSLTSLTGCSAPDDALLVSWISTSQWKVIKDAIESLAKSLDQYISYLKEQAKKVCDHHRSEQSPVAENTSIILLPINPTPHNALKQINSEICGKQPYAMICVGDFAPVDHKK